MTYIMRSMCPVPSATSVPNDKKVSVEPAPSHELWSKPEKTPFSGKNGTRYRAYSTPQKLNHMQYAEAKSDVLLG